MALSRVEWGALAGAVAIALAIPAALLWTRTSAPSAKPERALRELTIPPRPPLSAAFARPLFAQARADGDATLPADAPELIGIAGRIGSDAVALVRGADGRSRSLDVGAAVDGWTLESLAIDAAYFTRGDQRLRVPLPAG